MEFENFVGLYELQYNRLKKPRNRFEIEGFWFFSQILVKTQFLEKSR